MARFERLYASDDICFSVLFSVTSKLMQSIYVPRMNCCAEIFKLKWNMQGTFFLHVVIAKTIISFDLYACS